LHSADIRLAIFGTTGNVQLTAGDRQSPLVVFSAASHESTGGGWEGSIMISANTLRLAVSLNVLAALLFVAACRHHDQHEDMAPVRAEQADPNRPFFVMSEEKARVLRSRINALALGETSAKTIALVGTPSEDYHIAPIKARGEDWRYPYITYYFTTVGRTPGNTEDRKVDLIFDRQDKLIAIRSNVDGITQRGIIARPM
jgi:hypothetical protein